MREKTMQAVLEQVHATGDYVITVVGEHDDSGYMAGQALAVYQADCWEDIARNMETDKALHAITLEHTEEEYKTMVMKSSSLYYIIYEDDTDKII